MKRIFPLLLAVMLVVSLAVPAFATDYNGVDLPDIQDLDANTSEYPYILIAERPAGGYAVFFSSEKAIYNGSVSLQRPYLRSNLDGANWSSLDANLTGNPSSFSDWTIVWTNYDILDINSGDVYFAGDIGECDGTTCPATDDNSDGICDDCGSRLMLLNKPSSYPALPVVEGANQESVLIQDAVGYKYYVVWSADPYTISGSHSDIYRANMSRNVPYRVYTFEDGDTDWVLNNDSSGTALMLGMSDVVTLVESSFDWFDSETGDLFFPVPLWMEMDLVTQGEMTEALREVVGTMRILMVCGVGCLALLMVLLLFGKRSLIFRG